MCALAQQILTSCNSQPKKDETISTAPAVDTTNVVKEDWDNFKTEAKARLQETRDSIDSFKKKVEKANNKAKAKYEKRMENLQTKTDDLKARLDAYNDRSKEKWETFKHDFNNALDSLKVSLKDSTRLEK